MVQMKRRRQQRMDENRLGHQAFSRRHTAFLGRFPGVMSDGDEAPIGAGSSNPMVRPRDRDDNFEKKGKPELIPAFHPRWNGMKALNRFRPCNLTSKKKKFLQPRDSGVEEIEQSSLDWQQ